MTFSTVLANAGKSFLRAFGAAIIVFAPGIAQAPNLDGAKALGIAGLVASVTAGLRAIQDFVPQLQIRWTVSGIDAGSYLGSFLRASVGAFLVSVIGILSAPTLSFGSSVVTGVITGALAAGLLAIQHLFDGKPPVPAPAPTKRAAKHPAAPKP